MKVVKYLGIITVIPSGDDMGRIKILLEGTPYRTFNIHPLQNVPPVGLAPSEIIELFIAKMTDRPIVVKRQPITYGEDYLAGAGQKGCLRIPCGLFDFKDCSANDAAVMLRAVRSMIQDWLPGFLEKYPEVESVEV